MKIRLPRIQIEWEEEAPSANLPQTSSAETHATIASPQENTTQSKRPGLLLQFLGFGKTTPKGRHWFVRLISLKLGGILNLFIWCAIVGVVMKLTNFNPLQPEFDAAATADNAFSQGLNAIGLALKHSWEPALSGATIILPIWISWRIITFPFRR